MKFYNFVKEKGYAPSKIAKSAIRVALYEAEFSAFVS